MEYFKTQVELHARRDLICGELLQRDDFYSAMLKDSMLLKVIDQL